MRCSVTCGCGVEDAPGISRRAVRRHREVAEAHRPVKQCEAICTPPDSDSDPDVAVEAVTLDARRHHAGRVQLLQQRAIGSQLLVDGRVGEQHTLLRPGRIRGGDHAHTRLGLLARQRGFPLLHGTRRQRRRQPQLLQEANEAPTQRALRDELRQLEQVHPAMGRADGDQPAHVAAIDRPELVGRSAAQIVAADDPAQTMRDHRHLRRAALRCGILAQTVHARCQQVFLVQPRARQP